MSEPKPGDFNDSGRRMGNFFRLLDFPPTREQARRVLVLLDLVRAARPWVEDCIEEHRDDYGDEHECELCLAWRAWLAQVED